MFECPKKELFTYKRRGVKIQCIAKQFYRDALELLDSFDFTVCQATYDGVRVVLTHDMIRSVKSKELAINRITYPVASINRLFKYRERGYKVTEQTLVEMVQQISGQQFDDEKLALYID